MGRSGAPKDRAFACRALQRARSTARAARVSPAPLAAGRRRETHWCGSLESLLAAPRRGTCSCADPLCAASQMGAAMSALPPGASLPRAAISAARWSAAAGLCRGTDIGAIAVSGRSRQCFPSKAPWSTCPILIPRKTQGRRNRLLVPRAS